MIVSIARVWQTPGDERVVLFVHGIARFAFSTRTDATECSGGGFSHPQIVVRVAQFVGHGAVLEPNADVGQIPPIRARFGGDESDASLDQRSHVFANVIPQHRIVTSVRRGAHQFLEVAVRFVAVRDLRRQAAKLVLQTDVKDWQLTSSFLAPLGISGRSDMASRTVTVR